MSYATISRKDLKDQLRLSPTVIFYDIETAPNLDLVDDLWELQSPKLPDHPGEFDPASVKCGNLKPENRIKKIEEKAAEHELKLLQWEDKCQEARFKAFQDFKDSAPLSAVHGKVGAIGYGVYIGDELFVLADTSEDESDLLQYFWGLVQYHSASFVGYNSNKFDLPFITRRSWVRNLEPPYKLTKYNKMDEQFIDVLERWRMGGPWNHNAKLDEVALVFGVHRKLEGITGDQWWRLNDTDPELAQKYLEYDIVSLAEVSVRMGVC